jgi:hypothetical protein
MGKLVMILGLLISTLRNFVNDEMVDVIKRAIREWGECAEDGWQEGERTNFVISKAREIAQSTPNKYDDVVVEVLARLYIAYYVAKGTAKPAGA